ncbi:peptidase U32 family protein [Hyphomicrobium sp.]|uniref:ubiquinone anaerobic biosynthesis protein UbiU n=1 Tax=Hyphomicrobium sp. TaxID=82 RepID=UPI002B657C7E|nr:peptidase U32 family protein [Hyphomicrobium sp.]HRN87941.1 peptidase U32 family protein [Hyphomicrobium sp.]HRQ26235.1 peptidase U32 family protein [Hyphomicrobium sp.]
MTATKRKPLELVCPAGTPSALRTAVEAGADAVYCGFRDETNARNFPGLNFSREEMAAAITYARTHGAKLLVAINTYARAGDPGPWHQAIDDAAALGAHAVILADLGLLHYAAKRHANLRLHLSVQAAAASADAINFYVETFGVKRAVLPRVLTIDEIAAVTRHARCETETFAFGGLCVMTEGRCSLSSYATGKSPNMNGVCSPASHVSYRNDDGTLVSRLGDFTIDRSAPDQPVGYPTLCKGRFKTTIGEGHLFEEPVSLDVRTLLPALAAAGVTAIKIEGRQRSRAYIKAVVSAFRRSVDALETTGPLPLDSLAPLTEGQNVTGGAYEKTWR